MSAEKDFEREYAAPHKKQPSEDDKRRKKLVLGGLLKAELRPGGGDSKPSDGDQVMYHCTIRTLEGYVVQSTKKEFGGKGILIRHILGKSKMILGLLEGIPTMLKGEVAMFKMKPGIHYGEENCPVPVPDAFPKDDELHFEIELIDFGKAKIIVEDFGVVKKVINEGQGWETPRAPYEVKARISAQTGDGKLIFSNNDGEPTFFTFGKSKLSRGLEIGIGTMTRGERAIVYVTREYLTPFSFLPDVEGIEEVHFDVELVHFVQVRDVLGDGRMIKRRLREWTRIGQVWISRALWTTHRIPEKRVTDSSKKGSLYLQRRSMTRFSGNLIMFTLRMMKKAKCFLRRETSYI